MQSEPTLLYNGSIFTAQTEHPWVGACAFSENRILAVGDLETVRSAVRGTAREIDLHGCTAMPGIIDMHNHVLEGARAELFELGLDPAADADSLLDAVAQAVTKMADGDWLTGAGWGPAIASLFEDTTGREQLDKVSPNNPVLLKDISYHSRIANSRAIQAAERQDVEQRARSGEICRDPETGEWTGLFHEAAASAMDNAAPVWTDEQFLAAARHGVKLLNSFGVTGFNLAVASARSMTAYAELDKAGELSARMAGYIDFGSPLTLPRDGVGKELADVRKKFSSDRIFVDFAKFFMDGVPSQQTASMLTDYRDGTKGAQSHYSSSDLAERMMPLDAQGISVKIHAIGDRAIRDTLDAIEAVRKRNGEGPLHQIAHLNFISPQDIPRMAALGVVADLCPPLWFPSPVQQRLASLLGEEYVQRSHSTRTLIEAGTLAGLGTDWPAMSPTPSPWPGLATLVTRQHPAGEFPGIHRPDQRLDLDTALRLATINPASAMGISDVSGSLAPGKSADLIVLDRDLRTIDPVRIAETRLTATIFEGRCVFGEL